MNEWITRAQSRLESPGRPRRGFGNARTSEIMRNCVSAHFSFSAPLGYCASNSVASRDRRGGGASAWGGISPTLHRAALGTPGAVLRAETFDGPRPRARSLLPTKSPVPAAATASRRCACTPRPARPPGRAEDPKERARGPRSNVLLKERLGARAPPKADTRWPHSARADPGGRGLMLCRWSGLRGSRAGS